MGRNKKTHEEFIKNIEDKYHGEYTVLGNYLGNRIKVKVRHNCLECKNYEYEVIPSNLLSGHGCPKCKHAMPSNIKFMKFKRKMLEKFNDEYTILGNYVDSQTKILVRHNHSRCNNYEWKVRPAQLLKSGGCPVCNKRMAKLGINTIWDTDRWMCDLGVSEEDAKRYTSRSGKKITVICPDCGRREKKQIINIYNCRSIGCSCGDGKSYPEKFVRNLLEQLKVDFEIEYSPKWADNKRYDFYLPEHSCIVEVHGEQHYKGNFTALGGRTLEEERANDEFKKEIAIKNGVKYYIILDCRKNDLKWMINMVLNSELANLFDLSKIDWKKCAEFANKNIVKKVCEYWNNKREDETTKDLGEKFKLNCQTIRNYLKKGSELGWCNYNPKDKNNYHNKGRYGKKIKMFKGEQLLGEFNSYTELERKSESLFGVKLIKQGISLVCLGKKNQYKGFSFKCVENDGFIS